MSEVWVSGVPCILVVPKETFRVENGRIYMHDGNESVGSVIDGVEGGAYMTVYYTGPDSELEEYGWERTWDAKFSDREKALIRNCEDYAGSDPAGLPGHQFMLIIAKMADLLDDMEVKD
jgi:hypothetical protein